MKTKIIDFFQKSEKGVACKKIYNIFYFIFIFIWTNMNALVTLKNIFRPWKLYMFFCRQPFSKKAHYLVNGESDQKSVTSKRDAELNSRPHPPH